MEDEIYRYEENVSVKDTAKKFLTSNPNSAEVLSKPKTLKTNSTTPDLTYKDEEKIRIISKDRHLVSPDSKLAVTSLGTSFNSASDDSAGGTPGQQTVNVRNLLQKFSGDQTATGNSGMSIPHMVEQDIVGGNEMIKSSQLASSKSNMPLPSSAKKLIEARIKPNLKTNFIGFDDNHSKALNGNPKGQGILPVANLSDNVLTLKSNFENGSGKEIINTSGNTILLLGLHQSGKSSLINHLLQQDLFKVNKSTPQERYLVECTATIKDYGSIILVDTPGFTNDLVQDAGLYSTLVSYFPLDSKNQVAHPPNLILVLLNYETHFQPMEVSPLLSNFLHLLSHYQLHQFNGKPTIQFVMTHATRLDQSSMTHVSQTFMTLVKEFLKFPVNPALAFHSRETSKKHSQDLFETMRQKPNVLWDNAFSSPTYQKGILSSFVSGSFPLSSIPPSRISNLLNSIYTSNGSGSFEQSEIACLLEIGWENINPVLRSKYPTSLSRLRTALNSRGIKTFIDLPVEPLKILELLDSLSQHDPTTADLFTETLQLKIPTCYGAQYIGQGYDVSKDQVIRTSPFEFSGLLKTSSIGLVPEEVASKVTDEREIIFKFYETFEDYALDRFCDLGLSHVKIPKSDSVSTGTTVRKGYNVINPRNPKTAAANATIEHRLFHLYLTNPDEIPFKPEFWNTLISLPELDVKNEESVEVWKEFFSYWGTHVVKSAYGGGAIDVNFRGKILSQIWKGMKDRSLDQMDEFDTTRVFDWINGTDVTSSSNNNNDEKILQGFDVDSKFVGGDGQFQQQDLTKLTSKFADNVRNNWIQSLPLNPVILESHLGLVALSYFVRNKSETVATKMDKAFYYFYDGFMVSTGNGCTIL